MEFTYQYLGETDKANACFAKARELGMSIDLDGV